MQTQQSKDHKTVKYRLVGDVQQVGFRNFLKTRADTHNVAGFAANEPDGSLTVLLAGDGSALGKLEPLLHQGPPNARVISVTELLTEGESPPKDGEFIVR